MKSELLEFLVRELNEKSSFKDVRRIAEKAIQLGMNKSAEGKENWVFSALSELSSLENTTIQMKKIILQAIEVVMLSRRISNAKTKDIFSQKVNGNSNHTWLMSGAKLLISNFFPSLKVEYIIIDPQRGANFSSIEKQLKLHSAIWVVLGYSGNFHLSLLRLELCKDNLKVQVLDSLGAVPDESSHSQTHKYDKKLSFAISTIASNLDGISYSITATPDRRQKEGVNCFSFVLNDLEVAESYLSEEQSYFFNLENNSGRPNSKNVQLLSLLTKFYEISQYQENSNKKFTMQISAKRETLGNPSALNKSISSTSGLVKQGLLNFRPENHMEEGDSDVDEEINDCCIM